MTTVDLRERHLVIGAGFCGLGVGAAFSRERIPFDMVEAACEIVERFAEAATLAGVTLEVSAGEPVPGIWDRLRVEQILQRVWLSVGGGFAFCAAANR